MGEIGCLETLIFKIKADSNERKPGNGMTALHYATQHASEDCLRLLLENGARVNAINFNKETPLHHAVLYGSSMCAKTLIEKGANFNAKDNIGRTPLHIAAAFGKSGIDTVSFRDLDLR